MSQFQLSAITLTLNEERMDKDLEVSKHIQEQEHSSFLLDLIVTLLFANDL